MASHCHRPGEPRAPVLVQKLIYFPDQNTEDEKLKTKDVQIWGREDGGGAAVRPPARPLTATQF